MLPHKTRFDRTCLVVLNCRISQAVVKRTMKVGASKVLRWEADRSLQRDEEPLEGFFFGFFAVPGEI